ncbi:MAG: HNH endonuclease [Patescibacteria group bacterium]|nr:HNH endonuclease [Patescibacteria group bacterium]
MTDKQLIEWGLHPRAITKSFLAAFGVSETFPERFIQKVTKGAGCWIFSPAAKYPKYAAIGRGIHGTGSIGAHIASFVLFNAHLPDGLDVCHSCDERNCVNPHHLWLGTRFENMADSRKKGRLSTPFTISRKARGESHPRTNLTKDQVLKIVEQNKFWSYKFIAENFGVSKTVVAHICQGRTWRHVTGLNRIH